MIPLPEESPADYWANTRYADAARESYDDEIALFCHDVPPQLAAEALKRGKLQSEARMHEPLPLKAGACPALGRNALVRAIPPPCGSQRKDGHSNRRRRGPHHRPEPGVRPTSRTRDLGGGRRGVGDGRLGRRRRLQRAARSGSACDGHHPVHRYRRFHVSGAHRRRRVMEADAIHAR